jgi:hypothetical protein
MSVDDPSFIISTIPHPRWEGVSRRYTAAAISKKEGRLDDRTFSFYA